MKNHIIIAMLLLTGTLFSQNIQPKLEAVNKMVKATYFHDNGQVMQEGFFKNGKLQGEWTSYDSNGVKVASATYENGKKTGKWFFWNSSSLSEVDYSNNKIVAVRNWKKETIADED